MSRATPGLLNCYDIVIAHQSLCPALFLGSFVLEARILSLGDLRNLNIVVSRLWTRVYIFWSGIGRFLPRNISFRHPHSTKGLPFLYVHKTSGSINA